MGIEYPSWVSKKWEAEAKKDARIKAAQEYDDAHVACPSCGNLNLETTCMAVMDPLHNDNRARCAKCKWQGIVHDLVAASKPAQK